MHVCHSGRDVVSSRRPGRMRRHAWPAFWTTWRSLCSIFNRSPKAPHRSSPCCWCMYNASSNMRNCPSQTHVEGTVREAREGLCNVQQQWLATCPGGAHKLQTRPEASTRRPLFVPSSDESTLLTSKLRRVSRQSSFQRRRHQLLAYICELSRPAAARHSPLRNPHTIELCRQGALAPRHP